MASCALLRPRSVRAYRRLADASRRRSADLNPGLLAQEVDHALQDRPGKARRA